MKYLIIPFIFLFFLSSCKNENEYKDINGFLIHVDTISIDIKEFFQPASNVIMTHAVELDNKFFCFFNQNEAYNYYQNKRLFVIFTKDGKSVKCFAAPESIKENGYFDLFIRNDSIITKSYMGEYETYYFDPKNEKWQQIGEADDVLYEDDEYCINYIDYGEWGFTTWFRDKKTKKEYELASNCLIVNRANDAYYITDEYQILKVEDPHKLRSCLPNNYYENAKKRDKHYEGTNYKLDGAKIIYKDSTFSGRYWYMPGKFRIITSFVYNNKLLHLCADSERTYIAKLVRKDFIPLVVFENFKGDFEKQYYSFRYNNQPSKGQLMTLSTNKFNLSGLFKIKENKIDLYYIKHNIDSAQYTQQEYFAELIQEIHKKNFINISVVESFEKLVLGKQINKTIPVQSEDINQQKDTLIKTFLRVQNSNYANKTSYFYSKKNQMINSICIDWLPTIPYEGERKRCFDGNEKKQINSIFRNKLNELKQIITGELKVSPQLINNPTKLPKYVWIDKNSTIELYYSEVLCEVHVEILLNKRTSH